MLLTETEAQVFELFREDGKKSIRVISELLTVTHDVASKLVHKLVATGAVNQTGRGRYEVAIVEYEIGELPEPPQINYKPIDVDTSSVPTNVREYILAHAPYMSRSDLVKKTGIPKVKLNMLLIELKEGKQHS
jgi:hypothetical protein